MKDPLEPLEASSTGDEWPPPPIGADQPAHDVGARPILGRYEKLSLVLASSAWLLPVAFWLLGLLPSSQRLPEAIGTLYHWISAVIKPLLAVASLALAVPRRRDSRASFAIWLAVSLLIIDTLFRLQFGSPFP